MTPNDDQRSKLTAGQNVQECPKASDDDVKPVSRRIHYRRALIIVFHVALFAISLLLAFGLAYNFHDASNWFTRLFMPLLGVVLLIKLFVFWAFGLYHGAWQFVSLKDLVRITMASHVSFCFFVVAFFGFSFVTRNYYPALVTSFPLLDFRQTVFVLDWVCTIALVVGARVAVRIYYEEMRQLPGGRLTRLLVVGGGNAGELLLREIHRMPVEYYDVVGVVDDDPAKQGASIFGTKVLGATDQVRQLCIKEDIDEVLISIPSASRKTLRRIVNMCQGTNVRIRTVPSLSDLISGRVKVTQIRDVDINDVLGREPARLDTERISEYVQNKVILITGAGGSIGSELCRQVARFNPARLVLVEQAENALFHIERELRKSFPQLDMQAYICDVVDATRVDHIFQTEQPATVFHAAAHKHVPLMELNPSEAVKNNIFGTRNCADAAAKFQCQKFVMVSTDKAVNPTSVMGCTKRVAEMYVQSISGKSHTQFVTVRFGNVLASNGSVVPIFKEQIARGGPVTVTHPEMTRYFMTIEEASQLVMQAAAMGQGGKIFLLDMGEPVKIVDLARDLITLSGFTPGEDIDIVFSGVRPGEKLFEELSLKAENLVPTEHEKIAVWEQVAVDPDILHARINELGQLAAQAGPDEIRQGLKALVPEYQPNGNGAPQTSTSDTAAD